MPSNTIIYFNAIFIEREIQRLLASYAHTFLMTGNLPTLRN